MGGQWSLLFRQPLNAMMGERAYVVEIVGVIKRAMRNTEPRRSFLPYRVAKAAR
jgi:hypothetical protein